MLPMNVSQETQLPEMLELLVPGHLRKPVVPTREMLIRAPRDSGNAPQHDGSPESRGRHPDFGHTSHAYDREQEDEADQPKRWREEFARPPLITNARADVSQVGAIALDRENSRKPLADATIKATAITAHATRANVRCDIAQSGGKSSVSDNR
jgi:hypothetical protein